MKKNQIIIFGFILFNLSLQQEGCLLLDQNFQCLLCDFVQGYSPNIDNECEQFQIENCLLQNLKRVCLLCNDNYYFDSNTGKCIAIENKIDNCMLYIKDNQCKQCQENYLLKNSNCIQVENIIDGCKIYQNDGTCSYCNTGYVLTSDNLSCIKIETQTQNCLSYNFIKCEECENGYIHNPSYYSFIEIATLDEQIFELKSNMILNKQDTPLGKVCQAQQVSNCSSFTDFKNCKLCKENYFLTSDFQCSKFPSSRIEKCIEYLSVNRCKKCEEEYHIGELGTCVKNSEIENCTKYDQTSSTTSCIQCKNDYYVLSNKCIERSQNDITNCIKYNPDQDNCQECKENYKLTNDQLKCLATIEKCLIYENSDIDTTVHQCQQCEANFYLTDSKQCSIGTAQFCEILSSETQCIKCINKYYLLDETCQKHQNLIQCDLYSLTEHKSCSSCSNNSILMQSGRMCKVTGIIDGCIQFQDEENCMVCEEGYQLVENDSKQICQVIEIYPNCLKLDDDGVNCIKCRTNYILFPNPSNDFKIECKNPQAYYNQNCMSNNLQSGMTNWNDSKCLLCQENYIPYNQINQFVCMSSNYIHILLNEKNQEETIKDNCQKMTYESNNYKCIQCNENYYLQEGKCKEQCSDANGDLTEYYPLNLIEIESFTEDTINKFKVNKVRFCHSLQNDTTDTFYKCELLTPFYTHNDYTLTSLNFTQKCAKCIEDSISVLNPISVLFKAQNFQPIEVVSNLLQISWNELSQKENSPVLFQMPISQCLDTDNDKVHKIKNCQYYRKIQDDYYCSRCENFYKGKISKKQSKYIISECVPIDTCTALFYPGLPAILNYMTTCYECFEGKIPVIFANRVEDTDNNYIDINAEYFLAYNPSAKLGTWSKQYLNLLDADGTGFNVECYDRNSSEIALNVNFPLQCSIGLYWVPSDVDVPSAEHMTKKFNVDPAKIQLICVACKPGYKREGSHYGIDDTSTKVKYMIQDCIEIENCNRSQWLNYCTSCNKNYAFSITNELVNYDECIFTSDQNCYAIDKNTQKCKICKRGYVFNYDDICEQFQPPSCSQYSQFDNLPTTMVSTLLYMFSEGKGCNKCNDSEIAVKISSRSISCIYSDYIQNQTISTSSKYIKNCKLFFNESEELKCQECYDDYVVNNIFTICYSKANLSNCQIALDSEKCLECIHEYVSVDYKCQQKNLLNCLVYDSDSSLAQQKCIQCKSGYYLNQNQCLIGDIEYCDVYGDNLNQCQKCQSGYQKIQIKDADYCLQIDQRSFCQEVDQIKFQNQILECTKCLENENLYLPTVVPPDQEKTLCININEISNCIEYETEDLFQNSTLQCHQCIEGFYSVGFKCNQIKNTDDNCEQYELDKDQCKICSEGYFLNTSFQCQNNPSGIQGCLIYKNQTDCKVCKDNYFLQSNFCIEVEEDKRISNCKYYENPELCFECQEDYFLINNECVEVQAQNCETFDDINNCSSCASGWGLKKENSKTNCVQITDPSCIDYEIEFPFPCLKCAFGFYPNEGGVCQPVLNIIQDCISYKSESTCSQCKKGFILNPDQTQCINSSKLKVTLDPNCKYTYQISTPICQVCSPGYYMKSDFTCEKCTGKNCLFCDSSQTDKCTICNFGYYMNSKFECVGYNVNTNEEVVEVQENILILKVLSVLVILIFKQFQFINQIFIQFNNLQYDQITLFFRSLFKIFYFLIYLTVNLNYNMILKIFYLLTIVSYLNTSELYKRKFVDIEMMRAVVQNEVEAMESHPEIFSSLNIYYKICLQSIIPMLDNLALSEEDNFLYCKMIENTMPIYILPIFVIDPSKNKELIEGIIREFFKSYIELSYNIEQIRIAQMYENNIALLYNIRNIFVFPEGYYEGIIAKFLPVDYSLFSEEAFDKACNEFIDLIIFKMMEKLKDFLATDPKMFMLTFFELFEEQPFEFIQFFQNEISYLSKEFEARFKRRRLYLIDNLDNLAMKSLSIFKQEKKDDLMKHIAKEAKIENDENPDAAGLNESDIESFKNLQDFLNKDPYDPKKTEDAHLNFKMINACINYSGFKSQSLEKLYCYYITYNIPSSDFILKHEKYNNLLGQLFLENSEQYLEHFIQLKPSYFSDESQYYEEVYPRFKIELNKAAVAFKKKYAKLLERFYNDYSHSIKKNFMYYWRKILLQYLNSDVFVPGAGSQTLYSNLINFFEFSKENYEHKDTVDYFSLNELVEKFVTLYHRNIEKFTQFE